MRHSSVKLDTPVEFINITPLNPLISKCQIKVCYVGEQPNRNRSVITKEVATQMANSLPGSPIVGYFCAENKDYEEHNRDVTIQDGKFELTDTTKPYGFVDLGAKVWFQKYLDDGENEREYLMTEGYLWTGQYPEAQRIIDKGNNQSMELSKDHTNAFWSKDDNGKPQFYIINETVISKLCILGEEFEPCFEGANITSPEIQFSFDDGFKEQLFSMMTELKNLLNKGGAKMFTKYAVTIGDNLWNALYNHVEENYSIVGVYEEEEQKFAIVSNEEGKYFRLDFSINEEEFGFSNELVEISEYVADEEPQFSAEEVAEYAKKKKEEDEEKSKENEKTEDKSDSDDNEDNSEDNDDEDEEKKKKKTKYSADDGEEKCSKCGKPVKECECGKENKYNLEEIPEYTDLVSKYSDLESKYNNLVSENEELKNTLSALNEFKLKVERQEKETMINSFYMLSDEDKAEVVENIDTYSLEDIEAKLSIICVRNKVSFDLDDDKEDKGATTFSLEDTSDDASMPAWVKAALEVAKNKNI